MVSSYRHENSASAPLEGMTLLRYFDVAVVMAAAPILLLMGVPATGYAAGAGVWLALRAVGVGLERFLRVSADARKEISVRLGYLITRIFLLALTVILVRQGAGKDAALTALGVIVVAFTVQLIVSFLDRPRSR